MNWWDAKVRRRSHLGLVERLKRLNPRESQTRRETDQITIPSALCHLKVWLHRNSERICHFYVILVCLFISLILRILDFSTSASIFRDNSGYKLYRTILEILELGQWRSLRIDLINFVFSWNMFSLVRWWPKKVKRVWFRRFEFLWVLSKKIEHLKLNFHSIAMKFHCSWNSMIIIVTCQSWLTCTWKIASSFANSSNQRPPKLLTGPDSVAGCCC